jgi:HEAT repeat protein
MEELDDNDSSGRHAAHRALREITRKDFEYEPDKPLKERKDAQAKWEQWWKATQGGVVLVERFWIFQSQWKESSAVKLFDPVAFLKEVASRSWTTADPKVDENRARRVIEDFQRKKDVFVQDAVDLGAPALDHLAKFIGGETERDAGKANAATRCFVAESFAKIIEKHDVSNGAERLRGILSEGDSNAKKTGAAIALGFLSKGSVGAADREALQMRGLSATDGETRAASAYSLGRVGEESSAADLTKATGDIDVNVQIAALRAISLIHPRNSDTVKRLGEMVADEPTVIGASSNRAVNAVVREHAVDALGSIGDPASVTWLLRARCDTMRNVREAAVIAIQKVHKAAPKAVIDSALAIMRDEKNKTDDRGGAALLLGDTGDGALAKLLSDRIVDLNAPRELRDPDAAVRIRVCEAIGNLKAKSKIACDRLFLVMSDDYEREAVRNGAFAALCVIFGLEPEKEGSADKDKLFRASDLRPARDGAIQKWSALIKGASLQD